MSTYSSSPASIIGLRSVRLFAGLPDAVLHEVAARCHFRRYPAGCTVVARSDDDHAVCLLISGRVRVVALSPSGREVSFRDLGAGELFGELAAIDGGPRTATVVTLDEALLARLPAADFVELLRLQWPLNERLLHSLVHTVRQLTERVYEISTLSVQQRLAAELLRLALPGAGSGANRMHLTGVPTHGELGARIGSYREQVTREMAVLVRLGLLSKDGDGLVVEDIGRLSELIAAPRNSGSNSGS
jgi:CRP-like cAMP-binding protein